MAIGATERGSAFATTAQMSASSMVCNISIQPGFTDGSYQVENTLNKLFSAQRNHPQASPIPSDTLVVQQLPAQTTVKSQRSTLHSFWKQLPAPPVQPLIFSAPAPTVQQASHQDRCEDCDTVLQSENDSMDVDMDMDMGGAVESRPFGCSDCGKNVCGTCAVVSTKRHCLQCATSGRNSRRWW